MAQEWHLDVKILISTFQLIQLFGYIYSILLSKKVKVSTFQFIKCTSDKIFLTFGTKNTSKWNFLENRGCMSKISSKSLQQWYQYLFLCILGVEHIEVINGEQVVWIGSNMVSEWEVNFYLFWNTHVAQSLSHTSAATSFSQFCTEVDKGINLKWLYHTSYSPKLQFKTFI